MQNLAADQIERRALAALIPCARNARTHSDAQIAQIAASIREWGFTVPVLVDETGMIIAGHGRVMAASKIGLAEVPTVTARGWSEAQKRAYVIADNKLTENGGWDDELLKLEVADLSKLGFDMPLMGFSEPELARLMQSNPGLTDPDETPEPPAEPVTRSGDVWVLGRHRLVCGDATIAEDVARALAGAQPHLMVTDPPYGVSFERGKYVSREKQAISPKHQPIGGDNLRGDALAELICGAISLWAEDAGTVYMWCSALEGYPILSGIRAAGFKVQSQIVWAKTPFVIGQADYQWQHETCWYAFKGRGHPWYGGRDKGTVWDIPKVRSVDLHPTLKPVECMKRPIENNSAPGDVVYDPFAGAGTTIIAAEMTARACHAIEIEPAYCDVAVERWQNFTGEKAKRESNG